MVMHCYCDAFRACGYHYFLLDPVAVVALLVHVAVLAGAHAGLGLHHLHCWHLAVLHTESLDSQGDPGMRPVGLGVSLGALGQGQIWHLGE